MQHHQCEQSFFTVSLKSPDQLSKTSCLLPFTAAVSEAKRAFLYKLVSLTHLHVIILWIRLQYQSKAIDGKVTG